MRILITICTLFLALNVQAKLYKWVDETGEVHYSDAPPAQDAKPMDLPPLQTTPAVKYKPKEKKDADKTEKEEDKFSYSKFEIATPANDATIRDNSGNMNISLVIAPALNTEKEHYIRILLDNRVKVSKTQRLSTSLSFVDRGSHTLKAEVRDAAGKLVKSSNTVTFHMHRFSKLQKKPATQAGSAPHAVP